MRPDVRVVCLGLDKLGQRHRTHLVSPRLAACPNLDATEPNTSVRLHQQAVGGPVGEGRGRFGISSQHQRGAAGHIIARPPQRLPLCQIALLALHLLRRTHPLLLAAGLVNGSLAIDAPLLGVHRWGVQPVKVVRGRVLPRADLGHKPRAVREVEHSAKVPRRRNLGSVGRRELVRFPWQRGKAGARQRGPLLCSTARHLVARCGALDLHRRFFVFAIRAAPPLQGPSPAVAPRVGRQAFG
mmetsp:Transcript_37485/g.98318  ORF Transcript_37485/g.98318 Transcript_37485/m.98318 type:complete len:241 (-) Transcript_37485:211-933(-)